MKKFKLDEIDIKILKILQYNARASNIEIAEQVGLSPSPCLRRIKNLIDHKAIDKFYTNFNLEFFDYQAIVFASIILATQDEEKVKIFEESVTKINHIREIYTINNNTTYLIKLIAKDWLHYKQIVHLYLIKLPFIKKIKVTGLAKILKYEPSFYLDEFINHELNIKETTVHYQEENK